MFFFLRGKCWLWCHEKEPENWELIKKFRSLSFIELSYQAKLLSTIQRGYIDWHFITIFSSQSIILHWWDLTNGIIDDMIKVIWLVLHLPGMILNQCNQVERSSQQASKAIKSNVWKLLTALWLWPKLIQF